MARRSSSGSSSCQTAGKARYSALYVGCRACNELPSVDDVASGITELVRSASSTELTRLTLTVGSKGLKVVRHPAARCLQQRSRTHRGSGGGGVDKERHPLSDILLVGHGFDADVRAAAALILHRFDSGSGGWLHMHVYWFDDGGPETAARFVRHLSELVDVSQRRHAVHQLQKEMIATGQICAPLYKSPINFSPTTNHRDDDLAVKYEYRRLSAPVDDVFRQPDAEIRLKSTGSMSETQTDDGDWSGHQRRVGRSNSSREYASVADYVTRSRSTQNSAPDYSVQTSPKPRPVSASAPSATVSSPQASAVAIELRQRMATGAPILFPPKDYDTMSRSRGNFHGIEERRCVNVKIVGSGPHHYSDLTSSPQTYL